MDTLSYSDARGNFRKTMDKVCEDHAPVIVTRQNKPAVVMMALEDYNAIEETLYLLRTPKNAERLMKAVRNVEKKRYKKQALVEV
jgi:antitoxin YefM